MVELENLRFSKLKSKLEFRFSEEHLARAYYSKFMNRRQKDEKDFVTLEMELERLSQLGALTNRGTRLSVRNLFQRCRAVS